MRLILLILAVMVVGCGGLDKQSRVRVDVWCDSTQVARDWNNFTTGTDSIYVDHRRGTPCDTIAPEGE